MTTMRVFIFGFLVFLAYAIPARWYFVCELRHHCGDEPAVVARPMTLSLKDGNEVILQNYEQFAFPLNAFEPDLTANNQEFLAEAAKYLKLHSDKNITLTGRYFESEAKANSGIFENIGIARAAAVKRLLEKLGVDEKRISIDYQMVKSETLDEPLNFAAYSPRPDDYDKPIYSFKDNTFTDANFEFGSDVFRPGEQCILYADSVKTFLGENPGMILTIIGHTDSIGTDQANLNLGLRRAKNAAQYFRELGVKTEIVPTSKGETQPVAPNSKSDSSDNPEGRQKNRRVNFKIDEKPLN